MSRHNWFAMVYMVVWEMDSVMVMVMVMELGQQMVMELGQQMVPVPVQGQVLEEVAVELVLRELAKNHHEKHKRSGLGTRPLDSHRDRFPWRHHKRGSHPLHNFQMGYNNRHHTQFGTIYREEWVMVMVRQMVREPGLALGTAAQMVEPGLDLGQVLVLELELVLEQVLDQGWALDQG